MEFNNILGLRKCWQNKQGHEGEMLNMKKGRGGSESGGVPVQGIPQPMYRDWKRTFRSSVSIPEKPEPWGPEGAREQRVPRFIRRCQHLGRGRREARGRREVPMLDSSDRVQSRGPGGVEQGASLRDTSQLAVIAWVARSHTLVVSVGITLSLHCFCLYWIALILIGGFVFVCLLFSCVGV